MTEPSIKDSLISQAGMKLRSGAARSGTPVVAAGLSADRPIAKSGGGPIAPFDDARNPRPNQGLLAQLFYTIDAHRIGTAPFVLQFVGARTGAGTTTVATAYAMAAAELSNGPALYLDATFVGQDRPGEITLAQTLRENRPLTNVGIPSRPARNLYWVRLTDTGPFSLGLTATELERGFAALRNVYPIVVVDSAPLLKTPISGVISRYSDGTVLTIAARRSHPRDVKTAIALVQRAGGQFIGSVFNDDKLSGRRHGG
jgi:hypothetical protein